jgi:hypothetical protein
VRYDPALGTGKEALAVTGKPYLILEPTDATEDKCELSLDRLLDAADLLGKAKPLPRSQLKAIVQEFAEGRRWAKLRWQEMLQLLPGTARQAFEIVAPLDAPWLEVEPGCYLTRITDLIEILELQWLGRQRPSGEISTSSGGTNDQAE